LGGRLLPHSRRAGRPAFAIRAFGRAIERYSTEVVLRPYAGELLMLDTRKTEAA
jgi:hypothetical protein